MQSWGPVRLTWGGLLGEGGQAGGKLLASLSSLATPVSLESTAAAFLEERAESQQFTVLGGDAQRCWFGLYRSRRLLPPEALPLLIEALWLLELGKRSSFRIWASQRKTSSLQHVHSCPASGHVWERVALNPPFLGLLWSLGYAQPPQEAMVLLVTHPRVPPPGLPRTLV